LGKKWSQVFYYTILFPTTWFQAIRCWSVYWLW